MFKVGLLSTLNAILTYVICAGTVGKNSDFLAFIIPFQVDNVTFQVRSCTLYAAYCLFEMTDFTEYCNFSTKHVAFIHRTPLM